MSMYSLISAVIRGSFGLNRIDRPFGEGEAVSQLGQRHGKQSHCGKMHSNGMFWDFDVNWGSEQIGIGLKLVTQAILYQYHDTILRPLTGEKERHRSQTCTGYDALFRLQIPKSTRVNVNENKTTLT